MCRHSYLGPVRRDHRPRAEHLSRTRQFAQKNELPPLLLLQIAFAIGLGIILGVLNVFFRDVGQFFNVVLQFWFWLTPIVYPASVLPDFVRPWLELNPLAPLMAAYQGILVAGEWPAWQSLWLITLLAVLFCALGYRLFRKRAGEMVDEL